MNSQTVLRHHPQFSKNSILKKKNLNFEHYLCSNSNSYSVACSVHLFYEPPEYNDISYYCIINI